MRWKKEKLKKKAKTNLSSFFQDNCKAEDNCSSQKILLERMKIGAKEKWTNIGIDKHEDAVQVVSKVCSKFQIPRCSSS